MPDRRRHAVFIVVDTARADLFEPYGADTDSTPALADLARRGWAAPHAVASCSWTLPSHVGMLFGTPHREVGLEKSAQTRPPAARPVLDANRERYLPHVLHEHGFRTIGASANPWLQEASGFATGFDEFRPIWPKTRSGSARLKPLRDACDAMLGRSDYGLREAAALAEAWIEQTRRADRPSFLFLNVMECHSPYMPPTPFNDLSPLLRMKAHREATEHLTMVSVWRANLARELPPADALARMRHLYRQSAKYVDHWVGVFVRQLQDAGLFDDTLILITADHGENLGECGRIGHSFSLDERLIHVPLIVVNADTPAPEPVFSLTDVPALIAREVGLDSHPWPALNGRGVAVSRVEGVGTPDDPQVVAFLTEHDLHHAAELMTGDFLCAVDGRYKLVRRAGTDTVFDLVADPLEEDGSPADAVTGDAADHVARLRAEIDRAEQGAAGAPGPQDFAAPVPTMDDEETRQLEEQLRLLGYM